MTRTEASAKRKMRDPLGLRFIKCEWGWIDFTIGALMPEGRHLSATHMDDPFPRLLDWLEQIADGASLAVWSFSEEGTSARLIYTAVSNNFLGGGSDRLVLIEDNETYEHLSSAPVTRKALVREFYEEFRQFLSDGYQPDHWELGLPLHMSYNELSAQEEKALEEQGKLSWDAYPIVDWKSGSVERFLREDGTEQRELDLKKNQK